jgi:RNA polymerase sigma factor (sigma-70 family)
MDSASEFAADARSETPDRGMTARVYQWAFRFLQNHDDALDATQDVLVKWLGGRRTGVENRSAWLRRMTVNHCIDVLRARRARSRAIPPVGSVATPAEEADRAEMRACIVESIARLSEQQRTVLVAKVYDRETFAEIAGSLGISTSSAKTHYLRAIRTLRESLRKYG